MSDQPDAGTLPDNTQHLQETDNMPPAGSEPVIPVNERPHADTSDRAATGVATECRIYL